MFHWGKKLTEEGGGEEERRGTDGATEADGEGERNAEEEIDDANFRGQRTYSHGSFSAALADEGNRGGIDKADLAERTVGEAREGLAGKLGLVDGIRQMRPVKEGTTKGRCVASCSTKRTIGWCKIYKLQIKPKALKCLKK